MTVLVKRTLLGQLGAVPGAISFTPLILLLNSTSTFLLTNSVSIFLALSHSPLNLLSFDHLLQILLVVETNTPTHKLCTVSSGWNCCWHYRASAVLCSYTKPWLAQLLYSSMSDLFHGSMMTLDRRGQGADQSWIRNQCGLYWWTLITGVNILK